MENWEKMIDKITERKEFPETLRRHGFNNTADEYLEMIGALKLYFLQQRKEVVEEIFTDILEDCPNCKNTGLTEVLNVTKNELQMVKCWWCTTHPLCKSNFEQLKQKYLGG